MYFEQKKRKLRKLYGRDLRLSLRLAYGLRVEPRQGVGGRGAVVLAPALDVLFLARGAFLIKV